jgi:cell division protein FtsZ
MMGTGEASGDKRAIEAAEAAISNPLLDDVSMRGARGLLISITGGPDLTLYEVDEAATRIREEVDPEANIILGATFDESLEGIMRVSVVATGLAAEMLKGAKGNEDSEEEPVQTSPSVFGFHGKQPAPAKKPIQPAPMAARAMPAPVVRPQPEPELAEIEMDAHHEAEAEPERPAAAERVAATARQVRMPAIEDFPPQVKKQIEAQQTRIESIAEHAARKRPSLFTRLANVGLGRKDDTVPSQREPSIAVHTPKPAPQRAPVAAKPQPVQAEMQYDDEQLEIPAFLRRQAN